MSKRKAPKSTELALAAPAEIDLAWRQWAQIATEGEKALLAELVHSHDLSTSVGLIMLSQDMISNILLGTLSPAVANACLPWVDIIATQVQLANMMNGVVGSKQSVVGIALETRQRTKLKATFAKPQDDSIDVTPEAAEVVK